MKTKRTKSLSLFSIELESGEECQVHDEIYGFQLQIVPTTRSFTCLGIDAKEAIDKSISHVLKSVRNCKTAHVKKIELISVVDIL